MAVRIRLQRMGRKKRPFYRVVVADSRSTRDGRFIEKLGYYNPLTDPAEIVIDEERALNWLHTGAQPSETAKSLLSKVGILEKFHNQKQGIEAPSKTSEVSQPAPAEEAVEPPAEEEPAASSSEEENEASEPTSDSESEH